MPGAILIRFGVDMIGRIGKRMQPAQERPHLQGQTASPKVQKNAVPAGAALQNSPAAVAAKHMIPPDRVIILVCIRRIGHAGPFHKLQRAGKSADAPEVAGGDVNFSPLAAAPARLRASCAQRLSCSHPCPPLKGPAADHIQKGSGPLSNEEKMRSPIALGCSL